MFKTRKAFLLLYAIIWVLVLISPYFRYMQDISPNGWNRMIGDWTNLFLLLLLFLINLFVLVPRLLFNDKRSQYFVIVGAMLIAAAVISLFIHPVGPPQPLGMGNPPGEIRLERPFELLPLLGTILNNLITALLIIGSSTALELEYKWRSEQKLRKDEEKEHLKTNLALLRHQVSPHFLMNTLNNIHSLVEIDSAKAQDAIERLSTLMRYLLYDSAQNSIELKKEIEFINSFISLMQLRHSDEVEVRVVIPEQIPTTRIPPMLFISLLENAFKHGVNYPQKSYIFFELRMNENSLNCVIKNSKHKVPANSQGEYSGIGLENIKKSLKLLYDDDYRLDILDKETEFEVNLTIPL
ncbi:MAG: histidine kinase [Prolixibacteraceae bacterium]